MTGLLKGLLENDMFELSWTLRKVYIQFRIHGEAERLCLLLVTLCLEGCVQIWKPHHQEDWEMS